MIQDNHKSQNVVLNNHYSHSFIKSNAFNIRTNLKENNLEILTIPPKPEQV